MSWTNRLIHANTMSRGQPRNAEMFNGSSTERTGKFHDIFDPHNDDILADASDIERGFLESFASTPSSPGSFIASSSINLDFSGNDIVNGHVATEQMTRERVHVREAENNPSSVLGGNLSTLTQRVDMRVSGNLNATIVKLQQLQLERQKDDNAFKTEEDQVINLSELERNGPVITEGSFPCQNGLGLTLSIINNNNSLASHTNIKQAEGQDILSDLPAIGITCSSPTQWTIQENRRVDLSPSSLSPGSLTPAPSLSGTSSPIDLRLTPTSRSDSDSPLPPLKGTPKMGRKTLPPIRSNSVSPVNLPTPPKYSKLGNRALVPPIDFKSSFDVNFRQEDTDRKEVSHLTDDSVCPYLDHSRKLIDPSFHDHREITLTGLQEKRIPSRSPSSSPCAENDGNGNHRFTYNHDEIYSEFDAVIGDQDHHLDDKREVRFGYSGHYRDRPGNNDVHINTVSDSKGSHFNVARTHFTEICDKRDARFENSRIESNPHISNPSGKNVRLFSNTCEDRRSFHDRKCSHPQQESEIQLNVQHSQFLPGQKAIVSKDGDQIDCYFEFPSNCRGDHLTFPLNSRQPSFPPDGSCGRQCTHNLRDQRSTVYSVDIPYNLQSPQCPKHIYVSQRSLPQDDHDSMEIHAHFHHDSTRPHPHSFPDPRKNELSFRRESLRDPFSKCVPVEMAHDPLVIRCRKPSQTEWSRKDIHWKGTRYQRNSISMHDADNVHNDSTPPFVRNRERAKFSLPAQRKSEVGFNDNAKREGRLVKLPATSSLRSSSLCRARQLPGELIDQRLDTKCDVSSERRARTRSLSSSQEDRPIGCAERRLRKSGIADGDFMDKRRLTQGRRLLPCIRQSRHTSPENSGTNADGQMKPFLIRRKNMSS